MVSVATFKYSITSLLSCKGRGIRPEISRSSAQRYTEAQSAHCADFIQSPHIIADMSSGERKIKFSSRQKIAVLNVIRNMISS